MYYYNITLSKDESQKVTLITKDEYDKAVSELVDDFDIVDPTGHIPAEVTYYEGGFFLKTEDELILSESKMNYYKVSITKSALCVKKITKLEYDSVQQKKDNFYIFADYIEVNGVVRGVISYYIIDTQDDLFLHADVADEGFYVAMENEELSTFTWLKNCGTTLS